VTVLAAIRPDSVNLPLFLHVLGAMLLVGTLAAVATAILVGWRTSDNAVALTRFALRAIPYAVLPAYVLMRVGAQWTEIEQDYPDGFAAAWIDVGYITADAGALLIVISLILAGIGLRKLRAGGGLGLGRAVGIISLILLAAYVVAVWAMTAKPS
jgi:uncharacterized membrane protein